MDIPAWIVTSPRYSELSQISKLLIIQIISLCKSDYPAYPSLGYFSDEFGLSTKTISNSLQYLEDKKIIVIERSPHKSNKYLVNFKYFSSTISLKVKIEKLKPFALKQFNKIIVQYDSTKCSDKKKFLVIFGFNMRKNGNKQEVIDWIKNETIISSI